MKYILQNSIVRLSSRSVGDVIGWVRNLRQYLPVQLVEEASGTLFLLCSGSIILSFLLGGGTRSGFLSDAVLQLCSIPLLMVGLSRLIDLKAVFKWPLICALAFCASICILPLLQLIPLPPAIWTHLPGRTLETEVFALSGPSTSWMPISVSPDATWQSALSLIPPTGIFIGTLLLGYRKRRLLSLVVLGFGIASVMIGLLQVAQGQASPLRFFQTTNLSEAVGFFANRNHFAALLYSLTVYAAAWAVQTASTAKSLWRPKDYDAAGIVPIVASFMAMIILVAAQVMTRSRAGLALTMVALFAAFALAYADRRSESRGTARKLIAVTIAIAVIFSVQLSLYRVLERFDVDPLRDTRVPIARNTLTGAASFLPFGSGIGTFVQVYGIFEKPKDTLSDSYVNHAHDDFLELLLESGLPGAILLGVFVVGWGRQSINLWRRAAQEGGDIDLALARAASIVVGLIMLHSLVDYPLRTGAIMAMLAFTCALLIDPPVADKRETAVKRENTGGKKAAVVAEPRFKKATLPAVAPKPFQSAQTIDWPDEWLDTDSAVGPKSDKLADS
jgi:O-antigen ligase